MSKIKNGGLDQYGAEPLEQLQFGPASVEGVKMWLLYFCNFISTGGTEENMPIQFQYHCD